MGESRTKKGLKNLSMGLLGQFVSILLSFALRTVFIKTLSVEYLGIEGLFTNVLTLLSLTELGISGAIGFALYKPMATDDRKKICQLMNFYKLAYRTIAIVVLSVGIILSFFLDYLMEAKPNIDESIQVIFGLFLLNNVFSYFVAEKQSLLIANQDKYIDSGIKQVVNLIRFVCQAASLFIFHSYYGYLIIQAGATLFYNAVIGQYVLQKYPWLKNGRNLKLEKADYNIIFTDVKALAISKIAGVVSNGADNIIISKLFGVGIVGVLSNFNMIITAINSVVWQSLNNIIGNIGNFNASATLQERRNIFSELWLVTYWAYTIATTCLFALLTPFVTIWIGESFTVDNTIILVLLVNMYVGGITFPMYSYRVTLGLFDSVKWFYVLSALVNIVLSIWLGWKFGLVGVYAATVISRVLISDLSEIGVVCKYGLQWPMIRYCLRLIKYSALTILIGGMCKLAVAQISGNSIIDFILQCIICLLISNGILVCVFGRKREFKAFLRRIKIIINKI